MDEAGIDIAVLSLAQFNLKGLETCQIMNNGIARVVKEHPDRFIGGIQLPIRQGAVALQELRRGLDLGLRAPAIMSSCLDITFDDERMFPFYEEVSRLKLPIIVHASLFPKGC